MYQVYWTQGRLYWKTILAVFFLQPSFYFGSGTFGPYPRNISFALVCDKTYQNTKYGVKFVNFPLIWAKTFLMLKLVFPSKQWNDNNYQTILWALRFSIKIINICIHTQSFFLSGSYEAMV